MELEDLLEIEYLYPVTRNRSRPSQTNLQKYNKFPEVTRAKFVPFTAKPAYSGKFEEDLEEEFLIQADHKRMKREVFEGSGEGDKNDGKYCKVDVTEWLR